MVDGFDLDKIVMALNDLTEKVVTQLSSIDTELSNINDNLDEIRLNTEK